MRIFTFQKNPGTCTEKNSSCKILEVTEQYGSLTSVLSSFNMNSTWRSSMSCRLSAVQSRNICTTVNASVVTFSKPETNKEVEASEGARSGARAEKIRA